MLSHFLLYYNQNQEKYGRRCLMFTIKKDRVEYENKSLRLPLDLIAKVQTLADKNELSFNKVVIQCIDYALDHMDDKNE